MVNKLEPAPANAQFMHMLNLILVGIVCSVIGFMVGYRLATMPKPALSVSTFAECQKAGYPIREKYPAECVTPSGQVFVQDESVIPGTPINPIFEDKDNVFCIQDAKMCPDGSSVGRTPPNCEFAPCPKGE